MDYTKSGEALLVELINDTNNTNLRVDQLTIDAPVAAELEGFNSQITVRRVNTTDEQNERTLNYNRILLSELVAAHPGSFAISQEVTSLHDLLNELNTRYGTGFTTTDITNVEFVFPTEDPFTPIDVPVVVRTDHIVFTGQVNIQVERNLDDMIPEENLNGFNYEPGV